MRIVPVLAVVFTTILAHTIVLGRDSLDPLDPMDREQQMIRHLFGVDECVGPWMVRESGVNTLAGNLPAEYAILIHPKRISGEKNSTPPPDSAAKMILEIVKSDDSIWENMLWKGLQSPDYYEKHFKLTHESCEIDGSFCKNLASAWARVLANTRYSIDSSAKYPPVFQFGYPPLWYGEAPGERTSGLLDQLIQITQRLVKIVESKPEDRQKLIEECDKAAKALVGAPKDEYETFMYKGVLYN